MTTFCFPRRRQQGERAPHARGVADDPAEAAQHDRQDVQRAESAMGRRDDIPGGPSAGHRHQTADHVQILPAEFAG